MLFCFLNSSFFFLTKPLANFLPYYFSFAIPPFPTQQVLHPDGSVHNSYQRFVFFPCDKHLLHSRCLRSWQNVGCLLIFFLGITNNFFYRVPLLRGLYFRNYPNRRVGSLRDTVHYFSCTIS